MPPIPKDISNAIEYFCLREFYIISPIKVIVMRMQVYDPNPAKNNPIHAILILKEKLKIAIPKSAISQANTIEYFLPKLSVK